MAQNLEKRNLVITKVKEAVDNNSFAPHSVITSKDVIARCPEVFYGSVGVTVNRMAAAGLLKPLGQSKLEITEDLAIMTLEECIQKVDEVRPSYEHTVAYRSGREEVAPEPREQYVRIKVLDGLGELYDSELPEVVQFCLTRMPDSAVVSLMDWGVRRLAERAGGFATDIQKYGNDLQRSEEDNDRLREELKNTKVALMETRTELERSRGGANLGKLAERTVTIQAEPVDPNNRNIQSGGSGNVASGFVVHRKPLMGNAPKVVRRHSLDPEKK